MSMRVLIACGGTGGHINPGLAIADIIKEEYPGTEILFAVFDEEIIEQFLVYQDVSGFDDPDVIEAIERRKIPVCHHLQSALYLGF